MKIKTSMVYINKNFKKVFRAGYCDLYYIYLHDEPQYYNAGVYGWNCDIYADYKRDIAITTGYRNMRGTLIPHEIIEKYSNIAKDICEKYRYTGSFNELKNELEKNKENFLNELDNME